MTDEEKNEHLKDVWWRAYQHRLLAQASEDDMSRFPHMYTEHERERAMRIVEHRRRVADSLSKSVRFLEEVWFPRV